MSQLLSLVWLFVTPWTVAHQAPLFMGFPRQEYWSGLPFLPRGDLPDLGIKPAHFVSPELASRLFTNHWATWEVLSLLSGSNLPTSRALSSLNNAKYTHDCPPYPHLFSSSSAISLSTSVNISRKFSNPRHNFRQEKECLKRILEGELQEGWQSKRHRTLECSAIKIKNSTTSMRSFICANQLP